MHPFWLALGLFLAAALAGRAYDARRRERRLLRGLAERHRLHYSHEDLIGFEEQCGNLLLLRQGHCRQAWNVVHGSGEQGPITLFSYSYELGFGSGRRATRWWAVVLELEVVQDPWTAVDDTGPHMAAERNGPADRRVRISAECAQTGSRLRDRGVVHALESAPPGARWEARGRLLAGLLPAVNGADPGQLLTAALEVRSRLMDAARPQAR